MIINLTYSDLFYAPDIFLPTQTPGGLRLTWDQSRLEHGSREFTVECPGFARCFEGDSKSLTSWRILKGQ